MGTENDFCGTKIHAPERSCHLGTWSQDCKYSLILGQSTKILIKKKSWDKVPRLQKSKILGPGTKIFKINNLGTRSQGDNIRPNKKRRYIITK